MLNFISKTNAIESNKLKSIFIIFNLCLAIIAFSYLISAETSAPNAGGNGGLTLSGSQDYTGILSDFNSAAGPSTTKEKDYSGGIPLPLTLSSGSPFSSGSSSGGSGGITNPVSGGSGGFSNPVSGGSGGFSNPVSGGSGSRPPTSSGSSSGGISGSGSSSGGSIGPTYNNPGSQSGGTSCGPNGCGNTGTPGQSGSSTGNIGSQNPGSQTGGIGQQGGANQQQNNPQLPPTPASAIENYSQNLLTNLVTIAAFAGMGAGLGSLAGGKNGMIWGGVAGGVGTFAYQIARQMGMSGTQSAILGLGIFAAIFLLTYVKESKEIVQLDCLPWQAPLGGQDCDKCNKYEQCSEYMCRSLGQACELVNKGLSNQKCVWKNPYDTSSPIIKTANVSKGYKFTPDPTVKPGMTGVEIIQVGGKSKCIKAFFPLEFSFITIDDKGKGKPSQCKIDYNNNATTSPKTDYDAMTYYVGGDTSYDINHSEKLSLPGPDAINKLNPEIKNNGEYTLFVRCQDANGNLNVNPLSVRFCVEKGPDVTPPVIVNFSIPSGNPIQFNKSNLDLEVYVNEPSECKWSHDIDKRYDLMEGNMSCNNQIWEMNNEETYTCKAKLTGLESRKTNVFFIRCKDQPWEDESNRNTNIQGTEYDVIGTQPLNILEVGPVGTIKGATDTIGVNLTITTDNGYKNGEAVCYYSTSSNESGYLEFSTTRNTAVHSQRQDLVSGNYKYYFKCVDLGGNAAYNSTTFTVMTDKQGPTIIRAYKENNVLKLITEEKSDCSFSYTDCNFEIDTGIKLDSNDYLTHTTEWKQNKIHYIRCKDNYNNQPNPATCSFIARPSQFAAITKEESLSLF